MRIPASAIPRFAGLKEKISGDADNGDLRKAILEALPEAVEQTKDLAPYFQSTNERETAKKIFDFLKSRVKYKADDYRQVIQLPSAILRPGAIADCKSLSLFTAAILQNLGIPWHFVLASYTDSTIPGHIYVQTDSGIIIDVVWGKFNSEKKPRYKYKMSTKGETIMKDTKKIGLGAIETAEQWAIRNGVWYSFSPSERTAIKLKNITPIIAGGRSVVLLMIKKNAGGLANFLNQLDIESSGSPGTNPQFKQSSYDKKRTIELEWLKKGGNPNDLYNAINEGKSKTPTGRKFYELYLKSAKGEKISVSEWVSLVFSGLFGKKYEGETISGEPVSTTATAAATASTWIPIIKALVTILGTTYLTLTQVKAINDQTAMAEEANKAAIEASRQQAQPSQPTKINPLIIGGVIAGLAAIYFVTKKKK